MRTRCSGFSSWTWTKETGMARGLFKLSYGFLLDFFIWHGVLDTKREPDYAKINCRLHRTLEFPTTRNSQLACQGMGGSAPGRLLYGQSEHWGNAIWTGYRVALD